MTGNKPSTAADWIDPDDAPDLSTSEYQAQLAATPVRRGRPKSAAPKVRVGFRLSAELVERIRASGPGYNARVEKVLREGFGPRAEPSAKPRPAPAKAGKRRA
jgi:uncharacterized protein (DUF4415 family)